MKSQISGSNPIIDHEQNPSDQYIAYGVGNLDVGAKDLDEIQEMSESKEMSSIDKVSVSQSYTVNENSKNPARSDRQLGSMRVIGTTEIVFADVTGEQTESRTPEPSKNDETSDNKDVVSEDFEFTARFEENQEIKSQLETLQRQKESVQSEIDNIRFQKQLGPTCQTELGTRVTPWNLISNPKDKDIYTPSPTPSTKKYGDVDSELMLLEKEKLDILDCEIELTELLKKKLADTETRLTEVLKEKIGTETELDRLKDTLSEYDNMLRNKILNKVAHGLTTSQVKSKISETETKLSQFASQKARLEAEILTLPKLSPKISISQMPKLDTQKIHSIEPRANLDIGTEQAYELKTENSQNFSNQEFGGDGDTGWDFTESNQNFKEEINI